MHKDVQVTEENVAARDAARAFKLNGAAPQVIILNGIDPPVTAPSGAGPQEIVAQTTDPQVIVPHGTDPQVTADHLSGSSSGRTQRYGPFGDRPSRFYI